MKTTEIGIYTNVRQDGVASDSKHKMYSATCSICGKTVRQRMGDLKRSCDSCHHKKGNAQDNKINDMPRGWTTESELNLRIYYLWKAMILRTTEKFWEKYPSYKGTTVDESWLSLRNFVEDVVDLEGYDKWCVSEKHEMMLDKDTIVAGNKHYSKETCHFISHADSNRDVAKLHPNNMQKAHIAQIESQSEAVRFTNVRTGEIKDFPSLKEACRELDLNLRNAWEILSDKYPECKTTHGWKIEKIA